MSDDPEDIIEDIQTEARTEGEDSARWAALESRLQAIESRPNSEPVDLSPIETAIAGLTGQLSSLSDRLTAREAEASHETETQVTPPPEPETEIPPQIDIAAATRTAVKPERAPKPSHLLFRKLGRR